MRKAVEPKSRKIRYMKAGRVNLLSKAMVEAKMGQKKRKESVEVYTKIIQSYNLLQNALTVDGGLPRALIDLTIKVTLDV